MSYATNADLAERMGQMLYVQLTDDAGTGVADQGQATAALLAAQAEVNSYLAMRYQVPVEVSAEPEAAAMLRSVTLDLAEYRLHARRPPVPADVTARRSAAVEWLVRVAQGQAVLPAAEALPPHASNEPAGAVAGAPRVWGREEAEEL